MKRTLHLLQTGDMVAQRAYLSRGVCLRPVRLGDDARQTAALTVEFACPSALVLKKRCRMLKRV